mgnify:FL=1
MPRQARMISATCVYHTILRGVNKLNIRYGSGVPVPCEPDLDPCEAEVFGASIYS